MKGVRCRSLATHALTHKYAGDDVYPGVWVSNAWLENEKERVPVCHVGGDGGREWAGIKISVASPSNTVLSGRTAWSTHPSRSHPRPPPATQCRRRQRPCTACAARLWLRMFLLSSFPCPFRGRAGRSCSRSPTPEGAEGNGRRRRPAATPSEPRYSNRQTVEPLLAFKPGPCHDHGVDARSRGRLPFQTVQWPTKGPCRAYNPSRVDMAYDPSFPSPTHHPPTFRDVYRNRIA